MMTGNKLIDLQFDLEQEILRIWGLKEDIDLLMEKHMDSPTPMTEDEISNALMALSQITDLRCSKAFDTFEKWIKARHEERKANDELLETAATIAEGEGLSEPFTVPPIDVRTRIARKIRSLKQINHPYMADSY
jgi:hypothetical protein